MLPRLPRLRSGSQGCWRVVSVFVCYTSLYGVCSCRTSGVDGCTCPPSPGYRIKSGKTVEKWPVRLVVGGGRCAVPRPSPGWDLVGALGCGRPWRGDRGVERPYVEPGRSRRGPRSESGRGKVLTSRQPVAPDATLPRPYPTVGTGFPRYDGMSVPAWSPASRNRLAGLDPVPTVGRGRTFL